MLINHMPQRNHVVNSVICAFHLSTQIQIPLQVAMQISVHVPLIPAHRSPSKSQISTSFLPICLAMFSRWSFAFSQLPLLSLGLISLPLLLLLSHPCFPLQSKSSPSSHLTPLAVTAPSLHAGLRQISLGKTLHLSPKPCLPLPPLLPPAFPFPFPRERSFLALGNNSAVISINSSYAFWILCCRLAALGASCE